MKEYLGDSVYVDGWENGIVLTTENGYGPSNTIMLEPEVVGALQRYLKLQERLHMEERALERSTSNGQD